MPGIRAALVNQVSDGAAAMAELSVIRVGQDGDFLGGLKVGYLQRLPLNRGIVVVEALDQEVVRARAGSVDGKTYAIGEVFTSAGCDHARLCENQADWVQIGDRD